MLTSEEIEPRIEAMMPALNSGARRRLAQAVAVEINAAIADAQKRLLARWGAVCAELAAEANRKASQMPEQDGSFQRGRAAAFGALAIILAVKCTGAEQGGAALT